MRIVVALALTTAAASVAGCAAGPVRTGPYVDTVAPAPFLTRSGTYPTQNEAQAAVENAAKQDGYRALFPMFGTVSGDRVPTYFTMFACRPGADHPGISLRRSDPEVVTCHVDVMDERYQLLGRATMSFVRDRTGWRLASEHEREIDAR